MNTNVNNFDSADTDLLPVEQADAAASHYSRALANHAVNVENSIIERSTAPERDTLFQRLMSAIAGIWRPNQARQGLLESIPDVGIPVDQTATRPVSDARIVITSKQQLRTLYHLLHAKEPDGIPISDLQHLTGSGNQWDTVARLSKNVGHDIVRATNYLITNKTGKATRRANYWLTTEGKRIAAGILARSGYVHDLAAEGRHLNFPWAVASEFVASSALKGDDLVILQDGTKPQWLRLLFLLRAVNGVWVPRYVADGLLDSRNVREVVRQVDKKLGGQAIESASRTMPNRDGDVCQYGVYRLSDDWVEQADILIRSATVTK